MKLFIAIIALLSSLMVLSAQSQDKQEQETLFGGKDIHHGYYLSAEVKGTQIYKNLGLCIGGRGGWVINRTFSIGLAGYGMVSTHTIDGYKTFYGTDTSLYLRMGYGGLFLNYIHESSKLIHLNVNALIGAGGAAYTDKWGYSHNNGNNHSSRSWESSAFFVFEPGIGIEMNMLPFFRIELGASYRLVSSTDLTRTTNSDLSVSRATLHLNSGHFKKTQQPSFLKSGISTQSK